MGVRGQQLNDVLKFPGSTLSLRVGGVASTDTMLQLDSAQNKIFFDPDSDGVAEIVFDADGINTTSSLPVGDLTLVGDSRKITYDTTNYDWNIQDIGSDGGLVIARDNVHLAAFNLSASGVSTAVGSGVLKTGRIELDPPVPIAYGDAVLKIGIVGNYVDDNQIPLAINGNNWLANFNTNDQGAIDIVRSAPSFGGEIQTRLALEWTNRPALFSLVNNAFADAKHSFAFIHRDRDNARVTLGVQAQAGQTGAIQEWMDSTGTALAAIGASGDLRVGSGLGIYNTSHADRAIQMGSGGFTDPNILKWSGVDGATSVAWRLWANPTLANAGAAIVEFGHGAAFSRKAHIDKDGFYVSPGLRTLQAGGDLNIYNAGGAQIGTFGNDGTLTVNNGILDVNGASASRFAGPIKWDAASVPDGAVVGIGATGDANDLVLNVPTGRSMFFRVNGTNAAAIDANGVHIRTTGGNPAASVTYRGALRLVPGGAGVRDTLFVCLKADDDSYDWIPIVDGGA